MEFKKDQEMQDRNKHPQGPDESSLDSVPPSTMDSSLLDSPLYDEENAGNSDRDSSEEEEDAQQNPGYPSRQKETRVLPDSEEQARSRAASLANLQVTLQEERRGLLTSLIRVVLDPATKEAWVPLPRGGFLRTMGYSNPSRKGRLCLYPEEALYLLEKGTIWIHWEGLEEIPMSVQEAFSNLLNPSADSSSLKPHTTLSKYLVYSYLRTLGFTVRPLTCSVSRSRNVVSHFQSPPRPVSWPLIHLGLYASADGALRDLARMSHRWDPATDPADAQTVAGYNLYRPSQHPSILFRKSDPPEPHLRVIIQDVSCPFPSCDEIASWTRSYGSQTLIAVVDACHISFLSLDTSGPIAPLKNI